jgi:hypothetical protein
MVYLTHLYAMLDISSGSVESGLLIFAFLLILDWYVSEPNRPRPRSIASEPKDADRPDTTILNRAA